MNNPNYRYPVQQLQTNSMTPYAPEPVAGLGQNAGLGMGQNPYQAQEDDIASLIRRAIEAQQQAAMTPPPRQRTMTALEAGLGMLFGALGGQDAAQGYQGGLNAGYQGENERRNQEYGQQMRLGQVEAEGFGQQAQALRQMLEQRREQDRFNTTREDRRTEVREDQDWEKAKFKQEDETRRLGIAEQTKRTGMQQEGALTRNAATIASRAALQKQRDADKDLDRALKYAALTANGNDPDARAYYAGFLRDNYPMFKGMTDAQIAGFASLNPSEKLAEGREKREEDFYPLKREIGEAARDYKREAIKVLPQMLQWQLYGKVMDVAKADAAIRQAEEKRQNPSADPFQKEQDKKAAAVAAIPLYEARRAAIEGGKVEVDDPTKAIQAVDDLILKAKATINGVDAMWRRRQAEKKARSDSPTMRPEFSLNVDQEQLRKMEGYLKQGLSGSLPAVAPNGESVSNPAGRGSRKSPPAKTPKTRNWGGAERDRIPPTQSAPAPTKKSDPRAAKLKAQAQEAIKAGKDPAAVNSALRRALASLK